MQRVKHLIVILSLLIAPQTLQARWGVGNTGDNLTMSVAVAKEHAARMALRVKERSLAPNVSPEVKAWILANHEELAADILASKHVWVQEEEPTCALTQLVRAADIHMSVPTCRASIIDYETASKLLLHESTHHFGISDENFADAVALAIFDAWKRGATDWLRMSVSPASPEARWQHSMIWTGKEVLVFGGKNDDDVALNSLHKYDPKTDTWVKLSSVNAPKRYGHDAVWTGDKMIVWGGFAASSGSGQGWQNNGAIYDPASDKWTALATPYGPSVTADYVELRYVQTIVWTGKELIVWGGALDRSGRAIGGIYTPATNSWSLISTARAPLRSGGHTAIWADNKMIVWGGLDLASNYSNQGAIYDVDTNSWTPISTSDAPAGRAQHSAIWTGDKMIVFAGFEPSVRMTSDGGVYDPKTNSWVPFETEVAAARFGHSVVWTGSDMVVWGGRAKRGSSSLFNSISVFNLESMSFKGLELQGAPQGRYHHRAVWTGDSMIVWGGYGDPGAPLATGGIYYP